MFSKVGKNFFLFLVALVSLYWMRDPLQEILDARSSLAQISFGWYLLMFFFESVSFVCIWWLFRIVLPKVSWSTIAVSQLLSNASSRLIPGGAATGGAVQFRLLSSAGSSPRSIVGALAATTVITTVALFLVPLVAGFLSIFTVSFSLSDEIVQSFFVGPGMFLFVGFFLFFLVRSVRGLLWAGKIFDDIAQTFFRLFRRSWKRNSRRFVEERNRLASVVRTNIWQVLGAGIGKWFFGCLTLVMAVRGVGADLPLAVVLFAYAGSAVLAMVPLTPGGIGFVEVGLSAFLLNVGMSPADSALAVLVYRIFNWWFPVCVGFCVWFLHSRFDFGVAKQS